MDLHDQALPDRDPRRARLSQEQTPAPSITITCTVQQTMPRRTLVDSATVSGGGEVVGPDTGSDTITIEQTTNATVSPINITYGTALANTQLSGSRDSRCEWLHGKRSGNVYFTTAAGTVLHGGNGQTETVTFTPTDTTTYTTSTANVTVNVAPVTSSPTANGVTIGYGNAANGQLSGTAQAIVSGATVSVPEHLRTQLRRARF